MKISHIDTPTQLQPPHSERRSGNMDFFEALAKVADPSLPPQHSPGLAVSSVEYGTPSVPVFKRAGNEPSLLPLPSTTPPAPVAEVVIKGQLSPFQYAIPEEELPAIANGIARSGTASAPTTAAHRLCPSTPPLRVPSIQMSVPHRGVADAAPTITSQKAGLLPLAPHAHDSASQHYVAQTTADAGAFHEIHGHQPPCPIQGQLSAVTPTGVTEKLLGSRLFGVHLLADTYLSELAREESDAVLDRTPGIAPLSQTNKPLTVADHANTALPLGKPDLMLTSNEQAVAILRVVVSEEWTPATGNTRAMGASSITAAEATVAWPESLLRLSRGSDGAIVVWLRDFRLDGKEAAYLVNALVKNAQSLGAPLGRIMLNGREVWSSRQHF